MADRPDLVLGLVAAVGTNFDQFKSTLENLVRRYGYEPIEVRLSSLLTHIEDLGLPSAFKNEADRIEQHMAAGDRLRALEERGDAVARLAITEIVEKRSGVGSGNHIYILRSLKHPAEVVLLRDVYRDSFFLAGLYSTEHERRHHLSRQLGVEEACCTRLMARDEMDENQPSGLGQRTRDTFELSDVFIRLDPSNLSQAEEQTTRLLDLVFGSPTRTPTADEHAMYLAYAASLRSADLSRQVGASIVSKAGDLIAVGANDVPQAGGGLYWPGSHDQRDHARGIDSNEQRKAGIASDIFRSIYNKPVEDAPEEFKDFLAKLKGGLLFDITEYGRAVHAEMEALMSCVRLGTSAREGTLYTTTFPCHNCAKHIVAAGLRRVVYVEPYPKSQALALHDDAIAIEEPTGTRRDTGKVRFEPYIGVGPRRYMDLFSLKLGSGKRLVRKQEGRLVEWEKATADPRVPSPESVQDLETLAVSMLTVLKEAGDEGEEKH